MTQQLQAKCNSTVPEICSNVKATQALTAPMLTCCLSAPMQDGLTGLACSSYLLIAPMHHLEIHPGNRYMACISILTLKQPRNAQFIHSGALLSFPAPLPPPCLAPDGLSGPLPLLIPRPPPYITCEAALHRHCASLANVHETQPPTGLTSKCPSAGLLPLVASLLRS